MGICLICGESKKVKDNEFKKQNITSCCINEGSMVAVSGTRRPLSTAKIVSIWRNKDVYVEFVHIYYRHENRWKRELRVTLDLEEIKSSMSKAEIERVAEKIVLHRDNYPHAYGSDIIQLALKQNFNNF